MERRPVLTSLATIGTRIRVLFGRVAGRLGMGETAFLVPLAVVIGGVTAVAAVAFHELILLIRGGIYERAGAEYLYGAGIWILLAAPVLGGLAVGLISRKVAQEKEGHGIVDVMESVARTRGFVRPGVAVEKIFTSALTIGTGGSAGAEGPIVQIGAAISSAVGALFRIARHQMPTLVGCGCAAGISAIFNAPIGGLLFTLEVILRDFSIRTVTPIIVASVVANVTMRAIVPVLAQWLHGGGEAAYITVFAAPQRYFGQDVLLNWSEAGNFVLLGVACGLLGAALTRSMHIGESLFRRAITGSPWIKALRPAVGGALLGLMGLLAVLIVQRGSGGPFDFDTYPQPAFYGDGYGIIEQLLSPAFYLRFESLVLLALLAGLCAAKIVATVVTLGSGGSGGVIAPSLLIGATAGGCLGVLLRGTGLFTDIRPEAYALIGMAAVLAAVVHAPLASILILFEISGEEKVLLPAMLGVVVALGTARFLTPDSLYTVALRRRGVNMGGFDPALLHRLSVEQVSLEPATSIGADEPLESLVPRLQRLGKRNLIVIDKQGGFAGFLPAGDVQTALLRPPAETEKLAVKDLVRSDIPLVLNTDDLAHVLELFTSLNVSHLPVGLATATDSQHPARAIGMISRAGVLHAIKRQQ